MDGEWSLPMLLVQRTVAYCAPNGKGVSCLSESIENKPNDFILAPKLVVANHILPWQFQTAEAFGEKMNYNKQNKKQTKSSLLLSSVEIVQNAKHWSLYSPERKGDIGTTEFSHICINELKCFRSGHLRHGLLTSKG